MGHRPCVRANCPREGPNGSASTTERINASQAAGFPIYPHPEQTHLQEKLEYLKKTRQNLYSHLKVP
jgi:hypothetical protein